jgi:molybdate transport system substrate-binding protein
VRRRAFISLLGGVAAAWPLAAHAQQTGKLPTIGFLGASTPSAWSQWTAAFVQRLRELGWTEGRTVAIEYRWAEGRSERYADIAAEFVRLKVDVIVTVGSAVAATKQVTSTIPRGEAADVVILDGGAADEFGKRGLVRADSKVELARSLIGMVVRAGAAKPDISSVGTLRSTLLAAKSIAYSDSGSGTYLSTTLFPKLGIADEVAGKSRKVRGPPSGEPVGAVVARGEAEIGFQQVSELIHVPGITFVGAIPAEVQPVTFFAAALTSTVQQPQAASALIRFLASPEAAPAISKAGLKPLSEP